MPDPEQEHVRRKVAWEFAAGAADRVVGSKPIESLRDIPPQSIPKPGSLPPELRVTSSEPAEDRASSVSGQRQAEPMPERIVEVPRPPVRSAAPPPINEARAES